ncbi:MAG: type I-D CRISPR-associated protein Cas5/Csc1 [Chloroflexi bacterium]|nr:type I-D CRISPR-associated protein Cas5/Csc1 [Chloroflexota bacterium]
MFITRCTLTLHDSLFFATREMGTLYETERYIHNYALSYALFNERLIRVPYFCASYRPNYAQELGLLNQNGIYVTPARPLQWSYLLVTWKMGQVTYYRRPERFGEGGGHNYPMNYGRAKELAPESVFEFFVIHQAPVKLPRWIRLGKWASKALVETQEMREIKEQEGEFGASCPLNPLDVPRTPIIYDLISMPPVSLIQNAHLRGEYYEADEGRIKIPKGMRYTFPQPTEETMPKRARRKKDE